MPPKRKPKNEEDDTLKKQKVDDEPLPKDEVKVAKKDSDDKPHDVNVDENDSNGKSQKDEEDDEDLPDCMYGAGCYRKNPSHFQQFKHPHVDKYGNKKKTAISPPPADEKKKKVIIDDEDVSPVKLKKKKVVDDEPKADDGLSQYKNILQFALSRQKISAEDKRSLRDFRRKNGISDDDHFKLIKQFGWTEDEYDDGEKREDDIIDLQEEKKMIAEGKFGIITIKRTESGKSKEYLNTFSKVCTKFYETMSKAQANYTITEVGVVCNPELLKKYNASKLRLSQKHGGETAEEWGFHGTSRESIFKICEGGFLHPDDLKKKNMVANKGGKKKGKKIMKDKPVELLDDGYYGRGIYFTKYSDYALWYSEERESDQILLSRLLPGKAYQCNKRMDGKGLVDGYDSHTSPKGNEIVLFSAEQILPRYIVTFVAKDAEEREQES